MISDEQLALRAQQGDTFAANALAHRFTGFAYAIAADYFDLTGDRDDLRQEALLGVAKAIRDFRPGRGMNFKGFASICARRQAITAVKTATRGKHEVLTFALRATTTDEGEEISAVEQIEAPGGANPLQKLLDTEEIEAVVQVVKQHLSPLERDVVAGVLNGESHEEIQHRLGRPTSSFWPDGRPRWKVVENAFARAQLKLAAAFDEEPRPLGVAA